MKKALLAVFMLSVYINSELKAGVVVEDPVSDMAGTRKDKPRSVLPFVETSVHGDLLNIGISYYSGNVQLLVMSEDGVTSISENHSIFGFGTINKDFSLLNAGSYSITLIFDNGEVYVGRVRKD